MSDKLNALKCLTKMSYCISCPFHNAAEIQSTAATPEFVYKLYFSYTMYLML